MKNTQTQYLEYQDLLEFMFLEHENTDLYLIHAGIQNCKPGHSYQKPRSEYHVHFVLSGSGSFRYQNKTHSLSRGAVFVIPPHISYCYQASMEDPWTYAWVGFNGTKARQYLNQSGFDLKHLIRSSNYKPETFTTLISDILAANQFTVANELDRLGYLYQIIALLIESNISVQKRRTYEYSTEIYIEHALKYIENNYQKQINVNDIVAYVGVNRSYFSTIFKEKLQIAPGPYLQHFRVNKSKLLLRETNYSLLEIAKMVGYKDAFTFSKMFKKICGISPSFYRTSL